ncbi:MAG: cyclic nucleotide-binding/CBS domain-containing protein [Desulfobacteraceae bacterium]|nr:cyclic nucleotide-binding/CBS domain-containing protein [Desulfobacteraceae bacterium]
MEQYGLEVISKTIPFSFLPEKTSEELFKHFSIENYKKGTVLFIQDESRVENLYVVLKGSLQRLYESNKGKRLNGKLDKGDVYGGISILIHNSVSVATIKVSEDSILYTLPAEKFLEVCSEFGQFKEFFTNTFAKWMQDKSYAGIMDRQTKEQEYSPSFFNQPVSAIFKPNLVSCSHENTIKQAANKMTKHKISSIFIKDKNSEITGIMTDSDLRERVVAKGYDIERPISEIMSTSLITVNAEDQVFEAYLILMKKTLSHLPVRNRAGKITGVLTDNDLMDAQGKSPYLIIKEIKAATKFDQLENVHGRLPEMLLDSIKNGVNIENLTKLITAFSDAILDQIIRFAIDEIGEPPCKFAFMIMGSEGREEQTLKTDQDNAIVYEDVDDEFLQKTAQPYFKELSNLICTMLDKAGFDFCEGKIMAMNPKWCQPLSVWKDYFFKWIHKGTPEDLLNSSIFFDFKGAWGDLELTDELSSYLYKSLDGWAGFLRHLTTNALHFKPPVGFFGSFVVESKGDHKDSFDLKKAMLPITDCSRIYALKHGIKERNTLFRLFRLYTKHILTTEEYNDITQSYNYLMNLRLVKQVTAIVDEDKPPDNYIKPKNLSSIDQTMLKEIFRRIENFQQKAKVEFIGITG